MRRLHSEVRFVAFDNDYSERRSAEHFRDYEKLLGRGRGRRDMIFGHWSATCSLYSSSWFRVGLFSSRKFLTQGSKNPGP